MLLSSGKQTFLYHTSLDRVVLAEVTDTIDVPPLPLPPSLPPIEEPSSQGNNNSVGTQTTVTILEEIDPDKCNLEHNLTACTDEELDQMGVPGDPPVPTVAP